MEARFTDEYGEDLYILDSDGSVQTSAHGLGTRHTPAQAREIAAALLRAADEAEGRTASHMADEEIVIRNKVAEELETLPRFNDVADWCAHIGYRQAVSTARHGRRQ